MGCFVRKGFNVRHDAQNLWIRCVRRLGSADGVRGCNDRLARHESRTKSSGLQLAQSVTRMLELRRRRVEQNTKISLENPRASKSSPVAPPPPPLVRLEAPREDDERVVERVAPRRVDGDRVGGAEAPAGERSAAGARRRRQGGRGALRGPRAKVGGGVLAGETKRGARLLLSARDCARGAEGCGPARCIMRCLRACEFRSEWGRATPRAGWRTRAPACCLPAVPLQSSLALPVARARGSSRFSCASSPSTHCHACRCAQP